MQELVALQAKQAAVIQSEQLSGEEFIIFWQKVGRLLLKTDKKHAEIIAHLLERGEEVYRSLLKTETPDHIPTELIGNWIEWTLRPWYLAKGRKTTTAKDHKCPVCNCSADLAILEAADGKKYLACSYCEVRWPAPRLKCPACGTTDHQHLGYFFVNNAPEQQIHYCQQCKTYIKTLDLRHCAAMKELPDLLLVRHLLSHLDVLAQTRGYTGLAEKITGLEGRKIC
ncbi:formate dehydrogenase accessory protein FdhE [Carboxydocella sp. ULO1]|uniref:formate dehydrogenase accessory protein FdhE domain-containing protein n=1 Tax=Carboxydocella sp. ULO1 TaxID=1926599 RepID=UPI0009D47ED8|nr:formate dehydrogenase accessory protein FdhE [Carboxydocella sp. ULO1]GAW29181.1 hypothetical protein ULO1_17510 [Carboxydocella sp. ULO1]